MVSLLLEILVEDFPLLLQSGDQVLSLLLGHEHLLAVTIVLLLNLHLAHKVVLILDLVLNLGQVLGSSSVVSLLEEVLILADGELGGCKHTDIY